MDINYNKELPPSLVKLIQEHVDGDTSQFLLQEINNTISLEYSTPPLVDEGKTVGSWSTGLLPDFSRDYRNYLEQLSFEIIEQMIKSSPVRFAVEMKRAQIVSVFRNQRSWRINCADKELGDVVRANLINILSKMALDFSYSSLVYGASFQELVWEYKTKSELGLQEEGGGDKYVVAKVPNSIDPKTIDYIKRDKKGHFNGFVQRSVSSLQNTEIVVNRESALVIPYNEKWRNLWGESFLAPMYPIWFWYEVVLRSMVKYMERTGTPVVKVRAPSRATVTKPGTKVKVDGISWGMEIGSNLSRSTTVVIPSDRDEQGNPLWEIDYMSSTERAQPFMDILELLFQMILRAGLSADRALSQSSGGIGSYSIGEIHKEATALHNEMILIQWVYYLNQYFLPLYSLYNRGTSGPVITIETQGLDPSDRDNLKTILGVMQGSDSFKDVAYKIDWDSLFTTNNVPTLSDEEAESKKKKQQEEALSNQESMLSVQSKFATPSPTKQKDGTLKANLPNKVADKKLEDDDEAVELEQIDLFNPFHSKADGRFTSGRGGLFGGSKVGNSGELTDIQVVESAAGTASKMGRIVKTTGLVLGLGGLGLIGYAVLNRNRGPQVVGNGDSLQDLVDKGIISKEIASEYNNVTEETKQEIVTSAINEANKTINYKDVFPNIDKLDSVPTFSNETDMLNFYSNDLRKLGLDLPTNISVSEDKIGLVSAKGGVAVYNPLFNSIQINPEYYDKLLSGDKEATHIFLHELFHAGQEVNAPFGIESPLSSAFNDNIRTQLEGQNELLTKMYVKDKFGNYPENFDSVYYEDVATWAGVVYSISKKSGIPTQQVLLDLHNNGQSTSYQSNKLAEYFPDKLKNTVGYYIPDNKELQSWLSNEGIDINDAYKELLK